MRFTAFNQRATPELNGSIAYVSAATSTDSGDGQIFYLAESSPCPRASLP